MAFFATKYFDQVYTDNENDFAIYNALSVLFGGFSSNMIAGIFSDRYEKKNLKTKPYIAAFMSLMAIPTTLVCFLVSNSFPISMFALFLEYLLAEGWNSPAISMIQ